MGDGDGAGRALPERDGAVTPPRPPPQRPLPGGWSELMASPAFGLRASEGAFPFGGPGGYGSAPDYTTLPSPSQYAHGPFYGQYGSPVHSPLHSPLHSPMQSPRHSPMHSPTHDSIMAYEHGPPMPYRSLDSGYASSSRGVFDPAPASASLPTSARHGSAGASDDELPESAEMTAYSSTRSGERHEMDDPSTARDAGPTKRKGKRASVSLSGAGGNSEVRDAARMAPADSDAEA